MRVASLLFSLTMLSTVSVAVAACSVADIPGTGDTAAAAQAAANKSGSSSTQSVDENCSASAPKPLDITTLTACACAAGGAAHCVPAAQIPNALASELDKCETDTGRCIPDSIITSKKPPPACASSGKPGVCLSLCVPKVADYSDQLTRGDNNACADDERCIPCVSPIDGTETGVCNVSTVTVSQCDSPGGKPAGSGLGTTPDEPPPTCPFTGTPLDDSHLPACGDDNGGRCVDPSIIPKDIALRLNTCPTGLCVPDVYVKEKGVHLPTTCSSFAGIEGRCFSTVFKDVDAEKDVLGQDKCAADERCVPCFNPANGQPTPACSTVKCDSAKTTPPTLPDCCKLHGQTRGKCLPTPDVPTEYQPRVTQKECAPNNLCVPGENIDPDAKVQHCDADGEKQVCVSNCVNIDFFEGLFLDQGSCDEDHTCVPCVGPTGPTNAPGCT